MLPRSDSPYLPDMTGREVISEVVVRALDGAKDQPDMRAAGRALGTSARIIAETVRTAFLPFAAINFGVRKFGDYLREEFPNEFDKATSSIPEDLLREPPLNVAEPVMQGLGFMIASGVSVTPLRPLNGRKNPG